MENQKWNLKDMAAARQQCTALISLHVYWSGHIISKLRNNEKKIETTFSSFAREVICRFNLLIIS